MALEIDPRSAWTGVTPTGYRRKDEYSEESDIHHRSDGHREPVGRDFD
jgi:hypothetical protein